MCVRVCVCTRVHGCYRFQGPAGNCPRIQTAEAQARENVAGDQPFPLTAAGASSNPTSSFKLGSGPAVGLQSGGSAPGLPAM